MTAERHPHGTAARYAHGPAGDGVDPCREACCREAHNAARRKRRKTDAYGRGTRDAEPVRAHVEALHAAGMPIAEITRRAQVPPRTVSSLLYEMGGRPRTARVTHATAAKLLAVTHPARPTEPESLMWPAHGTRRRLQALVAVGWSLAEISRRLDIDHKHLHRIVGHRGGTPPSTVTPATHTAVAALYDQLWDQAPPRGTRQERTAATRAMRRAQARNWAVPAAWDDDHQEEK